MGWDYYQYIAQPNWFLDLIKNKLQIDNKEIINKSKKWQKRH